MQQNMLQVVVDSDKKLAFSETAIPDVEAGSVLVKVKYSGLCGSDLPRIFKEGAHYYPITLGHEFSGEVVKTGENVQSIRVGDNISCAPLIPCFRCERCHRGEYSLCKNYSFIGSRKPGGNAEYVTIPEPCCFVLPQGVSLKQGAFFEPMTVGLHPILMAGGCKDKNVVVVGVGTIGLLTIQSALALGAKTITAVDISEEKLNKAKALGADCCINSLESAQIDLFREKSELLENQLILETAGKPASVKLTLELAGPRATIALIGTLHEDLHMPYKEFELILRKELTLMGSWMNYSAPYPGEEWRITAELFQKDLINIDILTDGCFKAKEYIERVSNLQGNPSDGKILLQWGE